MHEIRKGKRKVKLVKKKKRNVNGIREWPVKITEIPKSIDLYRSGGFFPFTVLLWSHYHCALGANGSDLQILRLRLSTSQCLFLSKSGIFKRHFFASSSPLYHTNAHADPMLHRAVFFRNRSGLQHGRTEGEEEEEEGGGGGGGGEEGA